MSLSRRICFDPLQDTKKQKKQKVAPAAPASDEDRRKLQLQVSGQIGWLGGWLFGWLGR